MPRAHIVRTVPVHRSARVMQLEGMFDVPPSEHSETRWNVDLPIEEREWNIGLIVGASGSGKTTLARELFGPQMVDGYEWPGDRSILDAFPAAMSIKDVTGLLSSVGFSSPPSWMRPYGVLSNGEKFRVTIARALAEAPELAVIDEFTSVVDRTVARIGSAAIAKTVRRRNQKLIAVSCHYDVIEWLQPDWIYEPGTDSFQWRELQRRPAIELTICRVHHSAWRLFAHHHYLTAKLAPSAYCFVALLDGTPVAFDAWLPFVGRLKGAQRARRGHRTVCLPDYQGVGIGNALFSYLASMWSGMGYRVFSCTGHPAEVRHRLRSPLWKVTRLPSFTGRDTGTLSTSLGRQRAVNRLTASFEYAGAPLGREEALRCLNTWARVSR